MNGPSTWLAARTSERALARTTLALAVGFLVLGAGVVWYVGDLGVSMGAMAYDDDDRTVVIDAAERAEFARHYDDRREEGWCLYGSTDANEVRITEVVHARPLGQGPERVAFTCLPETAGQLVSGDETTLIGTVHSHRGHDRSELSKLDIAMFGRLSPLIEVMGVYTPADGPAFFTTGSMTHSLDVRVLGDSGDASGDSTLPDRPCNESTTRSTDESSRITGRRGPVPRR